MHEVVVDGARYIYPPFSLFLSLSLSLSLYLSFSLSLSFSLFICISLDSTWRLTRARAHAVSKIKDASAFQGGLTGEFEISLHQSRYELLG